MLPWGGGRGGDSRDGLRLRFAVLDLELHEAQGEGHVGLLHHECPPAPGLDLLEERLRAVGGWRGSSY